MNKLLLNLFIISLFSLNSYAQLLTGFVEGPDGKPIQEALIIDDQEQVITRTDELGTFKMDQSKYEIFGITKRGYQSQWFKVGKDRERELFVTLNYYFQEIQEATVVSREPQKALDISAVNIIDYQPIENNILTLKRDKRTYYIGLDGVDKEGPRFPFNEEKPRSLFLDCMGNTHIICNENVYQIWVSPDTMAIVDIIPKSKFDQFIVPCIAEFNNGLVLQNLSHYDQVYNLNLYEKGKEIPFYLKVDSISLRTVSEMALMMEFQTKAMMTGDSLIQNVLDMRRRMREIHNGANPDVALLGSQNTASSMEDSTFTANFTGASFDNNNEMTERTTEFMLFSFPLNVRSFQMNEYLCVVDFQPDNSYSLIDNNGVVNLFNNNGFKLESNTFSIVGDIKEVWQDRYNNDIYLFAENDGNHLIYSLDVLTGKTNLLKNLRNFPFTESQKIHNGWLYYREIENGYYHIDRLKLPVY